MKTALLHNIRTRMFHFQVQSNHIIFLLSDLILMLKMRREEVPAPHSVLQKKYSNKSMDQGRYTCFRLQKILQDIFSREKFKITTESPLKVPPPQPP